MSSCLRARYDHSVQDPLVRKQLPKGWIDLAVGEARVVREALVNIYPPGIFQRNDLKDCDYQPPSGYPPLVKYLEEKHGRRVVITNGAKQALTAIFYAVKQMGLSSVAMRSPFWSQMPQAIHLVGLESVVSDAPREGSAYLLVAPNNPDGYMPSAEWLNDARLKCKELGVPLIHDAAYYTETYVDGDLTDLSDITIHSAAKTFGLSGLRVGYIATSNDAVYEKACEYVEASSVGVSLLSQRFFYDLLQVQDTNPNLHFYFKAGARAALARAKKLMTTIPPDVLDTAGCESVPGMFGWFKTGPKFDPDKAKVHVAPGYAFGDPSRVRINLAIDYALLEQFARHLKGE